MLTVDEKNLKSGLLGLVVALVEIIVNVLSREALKRMEGEMLREEEIERLGEAILDLEEALERIKNDNQIQESVKKVRQSLDHLVERVLSPFTESPREEETCRR